MKTIILLLVLCLALSHAFTRQELEKQWKNFQIDFNKSYKSPVEARKRFSIFEDNMKKIEEHNIRFKNGEVSFTKGINKFADWTVEEFLDYVNQYKVPKHSQKGSEVFKPNSNIMLPDAVDWRTQGCITGVKDQGICGSCWAFSTTGSLEAQLYLQKGKLISLSEQNLIDCSWAEGNEGCGGGLMTSAWEYVQKNGCESEDDYPYKEVDGKCRFEQVKSVVSISGYVEINKNETDLQIAVASVGPISVGIDASEELQLYSKGILEDNTCSAYSLNHGVLLVGYGSESGKDFYIIKNSWGVSWGEEGYFRLGKKASNPCGITDDASYPNVI
ncbi:hypothetical protein HHI36_007751 [Cryptolaemus montrouzieri]|uniref:Cathepsin L n=1 Tax=Cryptolaemus montrouzieri TaxID=559131 RepID=A0ABD2MQS5_9CUCU